MSEEPVLLAIDADTALARITLNRPGRLNSFNQRDARGAGGRA